jgi:hypothetical protein
MVEPNNSANITSFFGTEPVRVISDPEGYHVCQLANEINKDGAPDNNMLVLGDLMDYTLGEGDNFNNFATETLTKLREAKSNSFTSVKYCLKHQDKIKVLFGNRDLNKLKLLPLGLITDSSDKYVNWWETEATYSDAAKKLISNLSAEHKWAISSMKNWKPFWRYNSDEKIYKTPAAKCDIWSKDDPKLVADDSKMSCLERYYLIFGSDCIQGTMSAQNTLFGVAQECGLYNEIFQPHQALLKSSVSDSKVPGTNYLLEIANTPGNEGFKNACELAAALVFTVFMDSLYGTAEPSGDKPFTGVLHKFFNCANTYFCTYATLGDGATPNLLTFSHGGMRTEFFTNCVLKDNAAEYFKNDTLLNDAHQQGGYLGQEATELESENITNQINSYNKSMKSKLFEAIKFYHAELKNKTPKQMDKPTAELLVNLVVSAPHGKGDGCMNNNSSPIMPGINGYRIKPVVAKDAKLYQFIGHGPLGFAPTIDKYLSTNGKASYLINLDISNSLFGQFGHLSESRILENYSYVEVSFNNPTLKAKSFVNVALNGYPIQINKQPESDKPNTIDTITINGHNLLTLLSGKDSTDFFKNKLSIGDKDIRTTNYHGQIKIHDELFDLFTTGVGFPTKVFLHAIPRVFNGGKSLRRHHKKAKHTGKRQPMKLYVRRSHTLVRRKQNMKRTAKKN